MSASAVASTCSRPGSRKNARASTGSSKELERESTIAIIDEGKVRIEIHLYEENRPLPNDQDGFRAVAKSFRTIGVERVDLESTRRMQRNLVQSPHSERSTVWVIISRQGRDFAQAPHQLAKTDRVDARKLVAFSLASGDLPETQPTPRRGDLT